MNHGSNPRIVELINGFEYVNMQWHCTYLCYEVLHTTGTSYIIEDVALKARNPSYSP